MEISKLGFEWAGFQTPANQSCSDVQEREQQSQSVDVKEKVKSRNTKITDLRSSYCHFENTVAAFSVLH